MMLVIKWLIKFLEKLSYWHLTGKLASLHLEDFKFG